MAVIRVCLSHEDQHENEDDDAWKIDDRPCVHSQEGPTHVYLVFRREGVFIQEWLNNREDGAAQVRSGNGHG